MPFDQSQITAVSWKLRYGDLLISWVSGSSSGTRYQVYVNGLLLASTKRQHVSIPAPSIVTRIDIGAVASSESKTDFSASLPSAPQRRVTIAWQGGRYLDASGNGNVAGFRVYASANQASYGTGGYGQGGYGTGYPTIPSTPTATIPNHTGNSPVDGYGMGGYGSGGYGTAAGSYSWTSDSLAAGLWGFSVAAYDRARNAGTASTGYQTISAPPSPPAQSQGGSRLSCTLKGYGVGPYGGGGYGSPGYGDGPYGGGLGYGQCEAVLTWEG